MRVLALLLAAALAPALASACTPRGGGSTYTKCMEIPFPTAAGSLTLPLYAHSAGTAASNLAAGAVTGAGVVFDVGGSPVKTCRVAYNAGTGVGQWALGPVDVTSGATVTVSYGIDVGSESDESDCSTSTGPFAAYACVYFAGSLTDWAGNSCTPSYTGSPSAGTGPTGPSLVLNGSSQYITFANSGVAGGIGGTVHSWTVLARGDVGTASTSAVTYLLDRAASSGFSPRGYWSDTVGRNGQFYINGATGISQYGPVSATTWAFITVVTDGLERDSYLDGALQQSATRAVSAANPTSNMVFGATNTGAAGHWAGQIQAFLWRTDTAANSTTWQAYETAMYLTDSITWGAETTVGGASAVGRTILYMQVPTSTAPSAAAASPLSVCDGLPGVVEADRAQVGQAVDCYGGDRLRLVRP